MRLSSRSSSAASPSAAATTLSAVSPSKASRGAQLLKLLTQHEPNNTSSVVDKSPVRKPVFTISAIQSRPIVSPTKALITGALPSRSPRSEDEDVTATAAESSEGRPSKRRLFVPPQPSSAAAAASPSSAAALTPTSSPLDALQELVQRFAAVETVLAVQRMRSTTSWWPTVAQAAASMLHQNPFSSELIQIVNGLLPGCWRTAFALRDDEAGVGEPQLELLLDVDWGGSGEAELLARRRRFAEALEQQRRSLGVPAADVLDALVGGWSSSFLPVSMR
jgi:hypothetical protein